MNAPRPCPQGSALIVKGEHFPCTAMNNMAPESDSHDGWPHGNGLAEAIWGEPAPSLPPEAGSDG